MIITLSGKAGSGKSSVANGIAKKLNLKHYSTGDFMREIAEKRGITILELSKIAEQSDDIDKELDERQIKLGKEEDNFVIDGRLSFHFIPNSIKIFLDVSDDVAAKRIFSQKREKEKENTSLEETKENIIKRQASEIKRYKEYYDINPYQEDHFDAIVDSTDLTIEEEVGKVIEVIKAKSI